MSNTTTTTTTKPTKRSHRRKVYAPEPPETIIDLPADHVACSSCGVAVPTADAGELRRFDALGVEGRPGAELAALIPQPGGYGHVELGKCQPCRARHDRAALIVTAGGDLADQLLRRLGGAATATHRLEAASDALAVAGVDPGKLSAEMPRAALFAAIDLLPDRGAVSRWSQRYAPIWSRGALAQQAAAEPWSHVTDGTRRHARFGVAEVLAVQAATHRPPVVLRSPDGRPCAFCGILTVEVGAVEVVRRGGEEATRRHIWQPLDVPLRTIGQAGRGKVTGHTCRSCSEARDWTGSTGVSMIENALSFHLRAQGRDALAREVRTGQRTVVPWAVLRLRDPNTLPNATPWAHLRLDGDDGPVLTEADIIEMGDDHG